MRSGASMGVMMMANKRGPRDVCPSCMEHCEQVRLPVGDQSGRLYRCSGCGHVHRYCELRWNDADEAEEARERRLARMREYGAEHRDRKRRYNKIKYINEGSAIRRGQRKRYATDPGYRKAKIEYAKEYASRHKDRRREIARTYYHRHRDDVLYRQKRRKLDELRRERSCGSAT